MINVFKEDQLQFHTFDLLSTLNYSKRLEDDLDDSMSNYASFKRILSQKSKHN